MVEQTNQTQQPTVIKQKSKLKYTLVIVKELKTKPTKTGKSCPVVTDQRGWQWWLFNNEKLELDHGYTVGYEFSENGQFKNLREVIPLEDVFKLEALKEIATKGDISKIVCVATGYAKDMCVGGIIEPEKLFEWANKIYAHIDSKTNSEYDKLNESGIAPKSIE